MNKELIKKIVTKTLPVMSGYLVLGTGFGILMISSGFSLTHILAMSIFIYAGSLQYAGCVMMAQSASFLTIALTSLLVNARHLFYGISMIDEYKQKSKFKIYNIFALTDETYSLVCNKDGDPNTYFLISIFNQMYWVTGSLIGGIVGKMMSFSSEGVEFSLTALFLVVATDQWINNNNHFPALTGLLSSLLCLIIFGPSNFLIPSMILITIILLLKGKKEGSLNG